MARYVPNPHVYELFRSGFNDLPFANDDSLCPHRIEPKSNTSTAESYSERAEGIQDLYKVSLSLYVIISKYIFKKYLFSTYLHLRIQDHDFEIERYSIPADDAQDANQSDNEVEHTEDENISDVADDAQEQDPHSLNPSDEDEEGAEQLNPDVSY